MAVNDGGEYVPLGGWGTPGGAAGEVADGGVYEPFADTPAPAAPVTYDSDPRSFGEMFTDFMKEIGSVAGGIPTSAGVIQSGINQMPPLTDPRVLLAKAMSLGIDKITGRSSTEDLFNLGKQVREATVGEGYSNLTPYRRGQRLAAEARTAEAGKEGGFRGAVGEFGQSVKEFATDPELWLEQTLNLVVMRGLGKTAGLIGAAGGGAVLQGGDVAGDFYETAKKLPLEAFKNSPEYNQLVESGMSPEEAKTKVVLDLSGKVGALAAAVSLATLAMPGGASLEKVLAGKTLGKVGFGTAGKAILGEAGSESTEELGGQLLANVVQQQKLTPDLDILKGVGAAGGAGLVLGGLFGGGATLYSAGLHNLGQMVEDQRAKAQEDLATGTNVNELIEAFNRTVTPMAPSDNIDQVLAENPAADVDTLAGEVSGRIDDYHAAVAQALEQEQFQAPVIPEELAAYAEGTAPTQIVRDLLTADLESFERVLSALPADTRNRVVSALAHDIQALPDEALRAAGGFAAQTALAQRQAADKEAAFAKAEQEQARQARRVTREAEQGILEPTRELAVEQAGLVTQAQGFDVAQPTALETALAQAREDRQARVREERRRMATQAIAARQQAKTQAQILADNEAGQFSPTRAAMLQDEAAAELGGIAAPAEETPVEQRGTGTIDGRPAAEISDAELQALAQTAQGSTRNAVSHELRQRGITGSVTPGGVSAAQPSPLSPTETAATTGSRASVVERELLRHHKGAVSVAAEVVEPGIMTRIRADVRAAQVIAKLFKKKLVFFRAKVTHQPEGTTDPKDRVTTDSKVGGFVAGGDSATIYLNENSKEALMTVVAHEMLHLLKRASPKVYAALRAKVAADFAAHPEKFAAFREYYNAPKRSKEEEAALEAAGTLEEAKALDAEAMLEEAIADALANQAMDPKFWANVFTRVAAKHGRAETTKIIQKLRESFVRLIASAINALKGEAGFVNYITDLEALNDAFEEAAAQYVVHQAEGRPDAAAGDTAFAAQRIGPFNTKLAAELSQRFHKNQTTLSEEGGQYFLEVGDGQNQAARPAAQPERVEAAQPIREGAGRAYRGEAPEYGTARENSVQITGTHYSSQPRRNLNGLYYGQGLKGDEAVRLADAPAEIKSRVYFYVDQGAGVTPEEGVGLVAHEVRLNNVYDLVADPLALIQADKNAMEMAIVNAGFDGYLNRNFGKDMGAVVLLGAKHQAVPVVQVGEGKLAPSGRTVPAPVYTRAREAAIAVTKARGLPDGEMPARQWGPIIKAALPKAFAEMAPTGVFDSDEKMYRSELAGKFLRASQKPPETRMSPARIMFEVAPDPNDKAAKRKWDALPTDAKVRISAKVAKAIMPKVFRLARVRGGLSPQFGGYLDDTNPSFAAVLDEGTGGARLLEVARLAGFGLSQDSMMALSSTPFAGSFETGVITVTLPSTVDAADLAAVHGIYGKIRGLDPEAIQGHTTVGREMVLAVEAGTERDLAYRVQETLGEEFDVDFSQQNLAFPSKEDYDYGSDRRKRPELLARRADARRLRREATDMVAREVQRAEWRARGGAQSERFSAERAGARNADLTAAFSPERSWYYSALERAFEGVRHAALPAKQWKSWLEANAAKLGVKADEIEWSGVRDYLDLRDKERVTKEEIGAFLRENGVRVEDVVKGFPAYDEDEMPKFGQYTLPGGENYRELLITLPGGKKQELADRIAEINDQMAGKEGNEYRALWEERQRVWKEWQAADDGTFKSSHWAEPNVLAHIRFNDRTDADGDKVLFVEELQSDWGQQGKREGFAGPTIFAVFTKSGAFLKSFDRKADAEALAEEVDGVAREEARQPGDTAGVFPAPFVTDTEGWLSLALKRVIAYAAAGDYAKVAFVNGEQSAERYDLSKQVSEIDYARNPDGTYDLGVFLEAGGTQQFTGLAEKALEDTVGKEVARKIVENEGKVVGYPPGAGVLKGVDLKVGGEGMKAFYDRIVPQVANKVLKKLGGGRMGEVTISHTGEDARRQINEAYARGSREDVERAKALRPTITQPGFDITPALKEKVAAGLPLFSSARLAPNGKPSKLTPEQYAQVRTPAFKAWFGDWEKYATMPGGVWSDGEGEVSKVVDPDTGEPMVLYHGSTAAGFTEFGPQYSAKDTNASFFSSRPQLARTYSGTLKEAELDAEEHRGIYPVFLNVRNPQEANFEGANWDGSRAEQYEVRDENDEPVYAEDGRAFFDSEQDAEDVAEANPGAEVRPAEDSFDTTDSVVREAAKYGHDGALIVAVRDPGPEYDDFEPSTVVAVFSPEQVKSATQNVGTFDPTNPDIRFSSSRKLGALKRAAAADPAEMGALAEALVAEPNEGFAIQGDLPDGGFAVLGPRGRTGWRISIYDPEGLPAGETDFVGKRAAVDALLRDVETDTLRDAMATFSSGRSSELATRVPMRGKTKIASATDALFSDYPTLRENPRLFEKIVRKMAQDPGLKPTEGLSLEQQAEEIIERMKDNLLWLFDQVPAEIRQRAKLWYDGAERIAEAWAEAYDITKSQAAGVLAVLSPQKDWYMNVTLAERILDIYRTKLDHVFDAKMEAAAYRFLASKKALQLRATEAQTEEEAEEEDDGGEAALTAYETVRKMTLRQALASGDLLGAAVWVRAYDEAYHSSSHTIVSPEGGFVETRTKDSGDTEDRAWGAFTSLSKALSILEEGSLDNISDQLGGNHKVRNFYNNIFAPGSPNYTTVDTHAAAAAQLRALSSKSQTVKDAFGSAGKSASTGLRGTYPMFYEAYKRAAEARGVLPREMQSITWEAVRGLFLDTFKQKSANVRKIDALWSDVDSGALTREQAREAVVRETGGVRPPSWVRAAGEETSPLVQDKSYVPQPDPFGGMEVTFEVAPNPANRALTRRWKNLSEEARAEVSHRMLWHTVVKALDSFDDANMKGSLVTNRGGYLGEANTSYSLQMYPHASGKRVGELARLLGYALRQQSMIRTAPKSFKMVDGKKARKTGAVVVRLGEDVTRAEIDALYARLHGLKVRRKRIVTGHTTGEGAMVILNFPEYTGVEDQELANRVKAELAGEYEVGIDTIYTEFANEGKSEYGFAGQADEAVGGGAEPSLRARADQLRAENDALLAGFIRAAEAGSLSTERSLAGAGASGYGNKALAALEELHRAVGGAPRVGWAEGTRIRGKSGIPLRIFRGASRALSPEDFGLGALGRASGKPASGLGVWFTEDSEEAADHGEVAGHYLDFRNPKVYLVEDLPAFGSAAEANAHARALEAQGYDGIIVNGRPLGGKLHFVAFTPNTVMVPADTEAPALSSERASMPRFPTPQANRPAWVPSLPKGRLAAIMDGLVYAFQDKHIDLKRVIGAIGVAQDSMDAYLQEELYHGRAARQSKEFISQELRPLTVAMKAAGVTQADFETYLHNRHAEERNIQIAKVNPGMPDKGSGIATADAKAYLAALPADRRNRLETLARRVDAMTKKTREMMVQYGLEKQSAINAMEQTYSRYVPLQREDVDSFEGSMGPGTGQGYNIKGSSLKRAMGSEKPVADILANIAAQRERVITRGEKNAVAVSMYRLAIHNPAHDFWAPIAPGSDPATVAQRLIDMGLNPADAANAARMPRERYIDPKTGLVAERTNPVWLTSPNIITARVKGENVYLALNANDPVAGRMAIALKNLDAAEMGKVWRAMGMGTRWFASVNTQYNPIFGAVNLVRDVQGAALNLETTPLKGHSLEIMRDTGSALRGIWRELRAERAGRTVTTPWSQLWEEFQEEGGQTGYRDSFREPEAYGKDMQKAIAEAHRGKLSQAAFGGLHVLSDYNEAMENAVRLAAYKKAKDIGMSNQRAASVAKNLTVNFNRKGSVSAQAGALFAFFNASVQGSARIVQTLRSPAGKKILAGGVLLGALQAFVLALAGLDDDKVPEFIKERNLIVPIGDGKFLMMPYPLGFHVIPNFGRYAMETMLGSRKPDAKALVDMLGMVVGSFNPVGSSGLSAQTVTPTVFDPLVALEANKDWTGRKIAKEDFSTLQKTPGFTRVKDTATTFSRKLSYALNLLTGGTDYTPGRFSPTPDQIDYLVGQLFGGVAREAGKAEQSIMGLATGEEVSPNKIPLVGRFYGSAKSGASVSGQFYANLEKVNAMELEIKGRRENREPVAEFIAEHPEARLVGFANDTEETLRKLRKRKELMKMQGAERKDIGAMDERIKEVMARFNDRVEALEGRQ